MNGFWNPTFLNKPDLRSIAGLWVYMDVLDNENNIHWPSHWPSDYRNDSRHSSFYNEIIWNHLIVLVSRYKCLHCNTYIAYCESCLGSFVRVYATNWLCEESNTVSWLKDLSKNTDAWKSIARGTSFRCEHSKILKDRDDNRILIKKN